MFRSAPALVTQPVGPMIDRDVFFFPLSVSLGGAELGDREVVKEGRVCMKRPDIECIHGLRMGGAHCRTC